MFKLRWKGNNENLWKIWKPMRKLKCQKLKPKIDFRDVNKSKLNLKRKNIYILQNKWKNKIKIRFKRAIDILLGYIII